MSFKQETQQLVRQWVNCFNFYRYPKWKRNNCKAEKEKLGEDFRGRKTIIKVVAVALTSQ